MHEFVRKRDKGDKEKGRREREHKLVWKIEKSVGKGREREERQHTSLCERQKREREREWGEIESTP